MDYNKLDLRTLSLYKQTLYGYFYRVSQIFIAFLMVPLTITFVGKEEYGYWVTILSVLTWINIADFGFGNGMRNLLTQAVSAGEKSYARKIVSTSILVYLCISLVFIGLYILFKLLYMERLGLAPALEAAIDISVIATLVSFVLKISNYIFFANHQSFAVTQYQLLGSMITLVLIYIFIYQGINGDIYDVSWMYSSGLVLSLSLSVVFVFIKYPYLRPSFKYVKTNMICSLINSSSLFFLIQISVLIVFSTDNVIILTLLSGEQVTDASILDKLFGIVNIGFSIVLVSFWGLVTDAKVKQEYCWIERSIKRLYIGLIALFLINLTIFVFFEQIVGLWLGEIVEVTNSEKAIFFSYSLLLAWNGIFTNVVNGFDELSLQAKLILIAAVVNVPLSYFFVDFLELGFSGVRLATILCLFPTSILLPLQVKTIINNYKNTVS